MERMQSTSSEINKDYCSSRKDLSKISSDLGISEDMKIVEHERLLQEARNEYRMKNMCVNLQRANTLQRIISKTEVECQKKCLSLFLMKHIKDLLTKKKESNRKRRIGRKEIAEMDEDILKLKKTISTLKQKRNRRMDAHGLNNTSTNATDFEELKRLEENNEKVADRVHLPSGIVQSLVPHAGSRWQEDPDLSDMMEECEKVSKSSFEHLTEISARLTSVCSINL